MELPAALTLTLLAIIVLAQGYKLLADTQSVDGGGFSRRVLKDRGASLLEVPDLTKDNDDDPVPDTVQYVQKKSVKQSSGQKSKSSSGGTCPVSPYNYVFYNRIPKAGSSSMLALIGLQMAKKRMSWVHSRDFSDRKWHTLPEEETLAGSITDLVLKKRGRKGSPSNGPVLYDQHVRYVNFTRHGLAQPIYMNIMRDPIARAVSSYYYSVGGPRKKEKIQKIVDKRGEQATYDVNQCLAVPAEDRRCGFTGQDRNLNTAFFCGHNEACRCLNQGKRDCTAEEKRRGLELAKHNIVHNYAVVGLMEEFNTSLALLEKVLPEHFKGVTKHTIPHARQTGGRTLYVKPNEKSRQILKDLFWLDYELYEFIAQRFHDMVNACL